LFVFVPFRLKKEHEKVRQETVKVILGEHKLHDELKAIKRETEELNKVTMAMRGGFSILMVLAIDQFSPGTSSRHHACVQRMHVC
jgi:hypothetical protein